MARILLSLLLALQAYPLHSESDRDEGALLQALTRPGHVALMRHALAPGTGDPPGFDLELRDTQRNLSEKGISQATRIGNLFRKNGIERAQVYSSAWYRCRDTAELLELGPVSHLAHLDSFFSHMEDAASVSNDLTTWLKDQELQSPLVLVTHQVNVTALTGIFPDSGEIIVLRVEENQDDLQVLGSIQTPH